MTVVKEIGNADGSIVLTILLNEKTGEVKYTPWLEFNKVKETWDNEKFLIRFFKKLKKGKTNTLKTFCYENELDFNSTLEDLLEIYKISKDLNFWKNVK